MKAALACLLAFVLPACDEAAIDLVDASVSTDAASPDGPAVSIDAPEAVAPTGVWFAKFLIGPTRDNYRVTFTADGTLTIDRQRHDNFGDFINCLLIEHIEGTWKIEGPQLTITPTGGTTARQNGIEQLDCNDEDIYAVREFTTMELADRDYFSGEFELTPDRLEITRTSVVWTWLRDYY